MSLHVQEITPGHFTLKEDHALSRSITEAYRWYSPRFSPKDVPRFLDVASITENPSIMNGIIQFLIARYQSLSQPPTHILGFDARGFLFGPFLAASMDIPFILIRKAEKNCGVLIRSEPYDKEYKEAAQEIMTIRRDCIHPNARVVLIDDVLATGGTALAGIQLVRSLQASIVEFVSVISLIEFNPVNRIHSAAGGRYRDVPFLSLILSNRIKEENCADPTTHEGPRVIPCSEVALAKL